MTTITPLPDRHCWHQITPRLGVVKKAQENLDNLYL
jgi:hypothetical protein